MTSFHEVFVPTTVLRYLSFKENLAMYNRISRLYSKRNHVDCYNIQESIGFLEVLENHYCQNLLACCSTYSVWLFVG